MTDEKMANYLTRVYKLVAAYDEGWIFMNYLLSSWRIIDPSRIRVFFDELDLDRISSFSALAFLNRELSNQLGKDLGQRAAHQLRERIEVRLDGLLNDLRKRRKAEVAHGKA